MSDVKPPAASSVSEISVQQSQPSAPTTKESETPPVKRKRKSRWGSEEDKVELPMPPIVIPQEISVPDPNTPSLSGIYSANVHVLFVCLFVGGQINCATLSEDGFAICFSAVSKYC